MKWLSKAISLVLCIAFVLCAVPAVAASTNNTIAGDINGDGNVNNKDLTRLFQYLSDWDVTVNEEALDVNGDNKVNNKDLTRLFQYLSDWDVEIFPQFNCDHQGGKATYHSKAICSVCGEEYGSFADISAFDQLNENQKGIYNVFNRAIGALETGWFDVPFVEGTEENTMESDIRVALHAVAYDHPEYFWMPKTYSYQISTDKYTKLMTAVKASFTFYSGNSERGFYNVTADEKQAMQAELDAKIEEILTQARRLDSDFEKERFIHDYLCENITYDDESSNLVSGGGTADFKTYTVYGALIEGTCVCEGYSRAMQLLLNRLGIKCGLVTGIGQGGPHMWNIINIDDGLYYTDVTFNDSVEGSELDLPGLHTYFNITKDKLEKDHSLDDMYAEGVNYLDPNIDFNFFKTYNDETEYYYFTKVGAYVYADNARDAAQYALDEYSKGHKMIEIEYDQSINSETAKYLLANALREKLSISGSAALQFGNYLIIVFK